MKTTQDFLKGLDKLTFIDHKDKVLYTKEGFEISYELILLESLIDSIPIQFQIRVRKDDTHVTTWGCGSNDDVILCVKWWQRKEWNVYQHNSSERDLKRLNLKNEFEKLTQ